MSNFWQKVKKTKGCWLWTGGIHGSGYGQCWSGYGEERLTARILTYEIIQQLPELVRGL